MELRQLEQFLAVVDHGGLGRAAERLYLSQPTVSGSIKALERELKVELFHRTARRLVPTSAGRQLVPLARRVLDDVVAVQDAMRSAREVGGGVLTVMCTPDMSGEAVASWAGGFTRAYPAVRLDISEVGSRHELVAAVADGRAELGFTLAPDELRGDLDFIELGVQRLLLVRPPGLGAPATGERRVPSPGSVTCRSPAARSPATRRTPCRRRWPRTASTRRPARPCPAAAPSSPSCSGPGSRRSCRCGCARRRSTRGPRSSRPTRSSSRRSASCTAPVNSPRGTAVRGRRPVGAAGLVRRHRGGEGVRARAGGRGGRGAEAAL